MNDKSRSKKALINTVSYLIGIVFEVAVSLVLPRFILARFGSSNNGLIASIEQFLEYSSLLYIGLAGATRAALYKPLSEGNYESISSIIAATRRFMRRVTLITIVGTLGFSCIYPFIIKEFSWAYTASLTLIIGTSTLFQYFFALPCRILLAADQRNYVLTIVDIATISLSALVSIGLILISGSIHVVKLGAVAVRIAGPVFLYYYVNKKYHIDSSAVPNSDSIQQRWDAAAHSIANFINKNTDIVILTLFTSIKEVSVYTIYYLVINGLNKLGTAISSGLEGAFGNIIARQEVESLQKNMSAYETLMFIVSTILYSTCAVLIVPFVRIYTKGVYDVSYERVLFGYLVSFAGFFATIRIPYQTVVQAAGKYRETRNGAMMEAILNISLSLLLVIRFGLVGVTIGTVIAMLFRSSQYAVYAYKNILGRSISNYIKHLLVSGVSIFIVCFTWHLIPMPMIDSYYSWIVCGVIVFASTSLISLGFHLLFWKSDVQSFARVLLRAFR